MTRPRVSLLMPVAAPAPFLADALTSVVAQSFKSWELVLVIDGADEGLSGQAAVLVPRERLRMVQLPTRVGISGALNAGLAVARGEFIARIDSDDRCQPDRLRQQVAALDNWPEVALIGSAANLIDASGTRRGLRAVTAGRDVRLGLLKRNQFVHSSVMFKRKIVEDLGGYDAECHLREDYELWLRVAANSAVANLAAPLVDYRISPGQLSSGVPTRRALHLVAEAQSRLADALSAAGPLAYMHRVVWRMAQLGAGRSASTLLRRLKGMSRPERGWA